MGTSDYNFKLVGAIMEVKTRKIQNREFWFFTHRNIDYKIKINNNNKQIIDYKPKGLDTLFALLKAGIIDCIPSAGRDGMSLEFFIYATKEFIEAKPGK